MHFVLLLVLGAPNLTIDGSQTSQTIDGMGVNINVNSWDGGELAPALDLIVDVHGSSLLRVIRDPMDWVSDESLIAPLHQLDAGTLQQVYEQPAMKDLWSVLGYLNAKGLHGSQLMVNFMGWTPVWLGGSGQYGVASSITAGKEGEWATMVASLVYYGRRVRNLDFTLLGPLNEEDLGGGLEGPTIDPTQYVTCLAALASELDAMGLTEIRLDAPDTAGGPDSYVTPMMANSAVAAKTDHLGFHTYGGSTSPSTAYPPRDYWLTETAASCGSCDTGGTPTQGEWAFASETNDAILQDLANGFPAVLVYDGYDSFYFHHNSYGYWGLLAYDFTTGTYSPRKRFWTNAQLVRFIRPGMMQVAESDTVSTLGTTVAFVNPTTQDLTIVGHNTGASSITLDGQLLNLTAPASLALYETSATQDLARGADVPVSGGTFTAQIPADTFFTLTTVSGPTTADGGTVADAGALTDAGTTADAGTRTDAGAPSGGDAGGGGQDGGSTPGVSSGCHCAAVAGAPFWALALAAVLMTRRRRRAASPHC